MEEKKTKPVVNASKKPAETPCKPCQPCSGKKKGDGIKNLKKPLKG